MRVNIKPIDISWSKPWDANDKWFYVGPSWQASLKSLVGDRYEVYGLRIQIGSLRIVLGSFDLP